MSKYLNALGESSAGTAKVDSMNAAFVDQTSSFNAKLRNIHSEVMGATDPVGPVDWGLWLKELERLAPKWLTGSQPKAFKTLMNK